MRNATVYRRVACKSSGNLVRRDANAPQALFVRFKPGNGKLKKTLTPNVDHREDGQNDDETADENEYRAVGRLFDRGEEPPVREDGEDDEEVERLEPLPALNTKCCQIVAFLGVHAWALTFDMSGGRRRSEPLLEDVRSMEGLGDTCDSLAASE